jgi:hypothetical protein
MDSMFFNEIAKEWVIVGGGLVFRGKTIQDAEYKKRYALGLCGFLDFSRYSDHWKKSLYGKASNYKAEIKRMAKRAQKEFAHGS